jgi:hypothetical protein
MLVTLTGFDVTQSTEKLLQVSSPSEVAFGVYLFLVFSLSICLLMTYVMQFTSHDTRILEWHYIS